MFQIQTHIMKVKKSLGLPHIVIAFYSTLVMKIQQRRQRKDSFIKQHTKALMHVASDHKPVFSNMVVPIKFITKKGLMKSIGSFHIIWIRWRMISYLILK